ncbi:hypothetical protein ACSQ67_024886 [Phaseolus vulgaris]
MKKCGIHEATSKPTFAMRLLLRWLHLLWSWCLNAAFELHPCYDHDKNERAWVALCLSFQTSCRLAMTTKQ